MSSIKASALDRLSKQDSSLDAVREKVRLRRWILDWIGCRQARVLELFGGLGVLQRSVWSQASVFDSCDIRLPCAVPPGSQRWWCRAEDLLSCAGVDVQRYNIFDFDCYGSPWREVSIWARRRHLAVDERVGVVLTHGRHRLMSGRLDSHLQSLVRWPEFPRGYLATTDIVRADLVAMQRAAEMTGSVITEHRMTVLTGPRIYSAFRLVGAKAGARDDGSASVT